MKRIFALTLTIVVMFTLCGCMKSEEIKNAEAGIATLDSNSTYKEIYENLYKRHLKGISICVMELTISVP